MISESVMKSKDFTSIASIATEFLAGLNFKDKVLDVQQYCQHFVGILEDLGGPLNIAISSIINNC